MKQLIIKILSFILALALGFVIGWRTTVINGIISVDPNNANIGYFECWGYVDQYYIDN